MLSKDTKVVVSGFGDSETPNNPTFQEITTLENSLSMVIEHLRTQKEYYEAGYLFTINLLENMDYIYSYLDKEITVAKRYERDEAVCNILKEYNND